jgi:hypothetical protein
MSRQQTTVKQTHIFELTPIHKGIFCVCVWEGENEWGKMNTSLLATQVCFAHLLCSQRDQEHNILYHFQKSNLEFGQLDSESYDRIAYKYMPLHNKQK